MLVFLLVVLQLSSAEFPWNFNRHSRAVASQHSHSKDVLMPDMVITKWPVQWVRRRYVEESIGGSAVLPPIWKDYRDVAVAETVRASG